MLAEKVKQFYQMKHDIYDILEQTYNSSSHLVSQFYIDDKWNGLYLSETQVDSARNLCENIDAIVESPDIISQVGYSKIADFKTYGHMLNRLISAPSVNQVFINMDLVSLIGAYLDKKQYLYGITAPVFRKRNLNLSIRWNNRDLSRNYDFVIKWFYDRMTRENILSEDDWDNLFKYLNTIKKTGPLQESIIHHILSTALPKDQIIKLYRVNHCHGYMFITQTVLELVRDDKIPFHNRLLLRTLSLQKRYLPIYLLNKEWVKKCWDTSIPDSEYSGMVISIPGEKPEEDIRAMCCIIEKCKVDKSLMDMKHFMSRINIHHEIIWNLKESGFFDHIHMYVSEIKNKCDYDTLFIYNNSAGYFRVNSEPESSKKIIEWNKKTREEVFRRKWNKKFPHLKETLDKIP